MSKNPNDEQLLAIEHSGGVLLRAGAGSGKTFVLVEHVVYLTKLWMNEFREKNLIGFEEFIRQKYSQVVMMTFTKKAAGEMSIRLNTRFQELADQNNSANWTIAKDSLPSLNVLTIDGFCKKLITSGYFPELSTKVDVIFETDRREQVSGLIDKWFAQHGHGLSDEVLNVLGRQKSEILEAMTDVFSDPNLRMSWKKFNMNHLQLTYVNKLLHQSFLLNQVDSSIAKILNMDLPSDSERSSFEQMIANFQATGLPEVKSVENLGTYWEIFSKIKRLSGETPKKKTPMHESALEALKHLREWVKEWYEVTIEYRIHLEDKIVPWMKTCEDLFRYIDSHLNPNLGMTFGDIEYFVAIGLENESHRNRIQRSYSYYIVDEFQDTSYLQFSIIDHLIGRDYSKLFCVGDAKQAIYGFRGGELSVFQDCADKVPKVLSLSNNYRSSPKVICFNNEFFNSILPMGQGFEGQDRFSVKAEDQRVPNDKSHNFEGEIFVLSSNIIPSPGSPDKISSDLINGFEAKIISESISENLIKNPDEVCTVLYSKLSPSSALIRNLMDKKIGFTAQFKINLLDDPILGMFLSLLRRRFSKADENQDQSALLIINKYLEVLRIENQITSDDLKSFDLDLEFWGVISAFRKFLKHLGLTNENSDINVEQIETLVILYNEDLEALWLKLNNGKNERLSLDLRYGERSQMVQLMSAHASKGLEFDNVYIAGIYTNGKITGDRKILGNMPASFKWFLDVRTKQKRMSPAFLYESELEKFKQFSESKRLFYVAMTRARKRIFWAQLNLPEDSFSIPKNSWVVGINKTMEAHPSLAPSSKSYPDFVLDEQGLNQSKTNLSLFHYDPMGIVSKMGAKSDLIIAPELSVTRLNSLLDCPRKYYFLNVLKLSESKQTSYPQESEGEELADFLPSSMERGTYIHSQIAIGIQRNFVTPRESFGTTDSAPIGWALDLLREKSSDFIMIPERSIKFKLFGYMISGTPDLVLLPKNNLNAQVWDFKTGKITQENLNHYWLQLSVYAYALFELGKVKEDQPIELVLCFVDQKKLLTQVISKDKCTKDLSLIWKQQNRPWQTNLDHCSQCSFSDICNR